MAWYADLSPCDYLGTAHTSHLKAVGWLAPTQPFTTGPVPPNVFRRLCELTQDPWAPFASAGCHDCEFCRFTGGGEAQYVGFRVSAKSGGILFVPGQGFLYVSPTSITHYIDGHGYRPPDEFAQAVLGCPPMRSVEYLTRVLNNGGRRLREAIPNDEPLPSSSRSRNNV